MSAFSLHGVSSTLCLRCNIDINALYCATLSVKIPLHVNLLIMAGSQPDLLDGQRKCTGSDHCINGAGI